MRTAAQVDGNHDEIVRGLRERGVRVVSTAMIGRGFPDLVCGFCGLTVLMEVKMPQSPFVKGGKGGKRERRGDDYDPHAGFTPAEEDFHALWTGQPIVIVRGLADALAAFGL